MIDGILSRITAVKSVLYLLFKYIRHNLVALENGSVFTNLKTDILKGYSTVKPDNGTLKYFDENVIPMIGEMRRIARENYRLSVLRDALLPKLMSGELDLSEIAVF
jgi:type I restriction enzyme S subunit